MANACADRGPLSATIRFISGARKGTLATIVPGTLQRLGRDPVCELHLEEGNVSRQHAKIEWVEGKLTVANLGSTNGIYVNGAKHEYAELRLWDVSARLHRHSLGLDLCPHESWICPEDISRRSRHLAL